MPDQNNSTPITPKPKSNVPKILFIWFLWFLVSIVFVWLWATSPNMQQGEAGLVVFILAPFIIILGPLIGTLLTYLILRSLNFFTSEPTSEPRKINWAYLILALFVLFVVGFLIKFLLFTPAPS